MGDVKRLLNWAQATSLRQRGEEPLTSSSNSYEDSRKFVLEIVEYVRKRETEIKKEYNLKKVEKKIIITQNNEKEY